MYAWKPNHPQAPALSTTQATRLICMQTRTFLCHVIQIFFPRVLIPNVLYAANSSLSSNQSLCLIPPITSTDSHVIVYMIVAEHCRAVHPLLSLHIKDYKAHAFPRFKALLFLGMAKYTHISLYPTNRCIISITRAPASGPLVVQLLYNQLNILLRRTRLMALYAKLLLRLPIRRNELYQS